MVIMGDLIQIDLFYLVGECWLCLGLVEVVRLLEGVEGVVFIRFMDKDVVCYFLVFWIVRVYEC